MRRLGWFASLVLVVGLVGAPKAQAQGTVEELLRAAPADAVATVVIRSFTDFQQDLAMVANTVVPGEGMTLPMLLQQALGTPSGQGLNLGNSLGVVVLPLEEGGASGGVLLPIASYQDFAASLEAVGFTKSVADGLDSYSTQGFAGPVTYYVAGEGSYRFWTQDKSAALAYQKRFAAQAPTLATELAAGTKALIAGADLSIYAPMSELAPRVQKFATSMAERIETVASEGELPEQQAEQVKSGMKVFGVEMEALGAVLAQLDWGLLTADINQGAVTVRIRSQAKPDTTAARFFQAQAIADTPLLAQLPAESWLAVSGKVSFSLLLPAFKDVSSKIIQAMGTTDPEALARWDRLIQGSEVNTGEVALALLPGGESGGFLNLVELLTVTDPAKALALTREGFLFWQQTPMSSLLGGGPVDFSKAEITSPLETYRGVEINQVSVPLTVPENVEARAQEMAARVYGDRFVYQYAASGNTIVLALGTRANELLKKVIDGLKDGATGIGPSPAYQSATAALPKSRSVTGFFSLVRVVQEGMGMAASFAGEAGEPPVQVESLEGVTPSGVGLAVSFEAGQIVADVYVPQAELANLGAVIQHMMSMRGGAPPMAPVEPGAPVPVPPAQE